MQLVDDRARARALILLLEEIRAEARHLPRDHRLETLLTRAMLRISRCLPDDERDVLEAISA